MSIFTRTQSRRLGSSSLIDKLQNTPEGPYRSPRQILCQLEPNQQATLRRPRGLFEFRVRLVPNDELAAIAALT